VVAVGIDLARKISVCERQKRKREKKERKEREKRKREKKDPGT
jgi:hypothetical protein